MAAKDTKVKPAKAKTLDFSDVKESGGRFNTKRQPAGDYKALVMSVEDSPTKETNEPQWLFIIKVGSGMYPYRTKLVANQLWKVRNLFVAAGLPAPKKKETVDPNKVVGKPIAVTLEDDEYDGKMKSQIASVFPPSELGEGAGDDDDSDDEPEEKPAKKGKDKAGKKGKKMKSLDIEEM
jgi:hypothetical protein